MGIVELFLIAVGLSMDAFAVSVCKGLAMRRSLYMEERCNRWLVFWRFSSINAASWICAWCAV